MDIKNLTGLEKPTEKLIKTISEGLGVVGNHVFKFDAKKIKRIGEAEAEVEKKKIIKRAESEEKALEILDRASKRFKLEQYNKQINLENIIIKTKENLKGSNVSNKPVDRDWTSRFMNIAQDVSKEEMQDLLSKILAEEIKKPKTFSLRTLNVVRNLNKDDILLFKKFSIISAENKYIFISNNGINENDDIPGISYTEIMKIMELGLIQSNTSTVLKFGKIKKGEKIDILFKDGLIYSFESEIEQTDFNLPVLSFSTIGIELSQVLDLSEEDKTFFLKYIKKLKIFLKTKKLEF